MSLGENLEQRWYLDDHEVRDGAELEVRIGDGTWRRVRLEQRKVKVEGWFPATMWVAYGLLDDADEEVPISPEVEFRWLPSEGPPTDTRATTRPRDTPDLDEILGRLGRGFFDDDEEGDEDDDGLDEDEWDEK